MASNVPSIISITESASDSDDPRESASESGDEQKFQVARIAQLDKPSKASICRPRSLQTTSKKSNEGSRRTRVAGGASTKVGVGIAQRISEFAGEELVLGGRKLSVYCRHVTSSFCQRSLS